MKKTIKLLTLALCVIALISCIAIFASADDGDAGAAVTAPELPTYNAEALLATVDAAAYPVENFPFALFIKADGTDEYVFNNCYAYWSNNDVTSVLGYLYKKKSNVGKACDAIAILRSDYTGEGDKTKEDLLDNPNQLSFRSLTLDLNGKVLKLPIRLMQYQFKSTANLSTQDDHGLTLNVVNGTVVDGAYKVAEDGTVTRLNSIIYCNTAQTKDKTYQFGKFFSANYHNVTFRGYTLGVDLRIGNPSNTNATWDFSKCDDGIYKINYNFVNCRSEALEAGEDGKYAASPVALFSVTGAHENIQAVAACNHGLDANEDGACDFCGYAPPVDFVVNTEFGDEFKGTFVSKLEAFVEYIEISATGAEPIVKAVSEFTPDTEGNYSVEFTIPMANINDTVTIRLLNGGKNPVDMRNVRGEIVTSYTGGIFTSIKDDIANGDTTLAATITALSEELAAKTAALEEALANKMDASEVVASINKLRSDIEKAYKLADDEVLAELNKVSAELTKLNTTLEEAKTTINQAIADLREDLEEKTAELAAAVATKADDTEMLAKYSELKSAYEAADVLLGANDEALAEADAAMQAAINELKKSVDEQEERISSAETTNTVQLVVIIVVFAVAVVALVLPIVKGKKKAD